MGLQALMRGFLCQFAALFVFSLLCLCVYGNMYSGAREIQSSNLVSSVNELCTKLESPVA